MGRTPLGLFSWFKTVVGWGAGQGMREEHEGWSLSPAPPSLLTAPFSSRQLMAPEPLEKLGFRDLMEGKPEAKDDC